MYPEVWITPTATTSLHSLTHLRWPRDLGLHVLNGMLPPIRQETPLRLLLPQPQVLLLPRTVGRRFLLHMYLVQVLSFIFLGRPETLQPISHHHRLWGLPSQSRARRKCREVGRAITPVRSFTTSRTRPRTVKRPRTRSGSVRIPILLSSRNTIAGVTKKRFSK